MRHMKYQLREVSFYGYQLDTSKELPNDGLEFLLTYSNN